MIRNNSTFNTQNSKLTKRIFLSPPHMGGEEMRFVKEAFESNYIAPLGPQVDAFEREFGEYIGIKHCTAASSGTAAMPWWNRKNRGIPQGKHLGPRLLNRA